MSVADVVLATSAGADLHRDPVLDDAFAEYERGADRTVCLHLPVDECDHAVYRCLHCCQHPS